MAFHDVYQTAIMADVICKICVSVLSIRLILLISKWVKTAYRERNEWETVKENTENR